MEIHKLLKTSSLLLIYSFLLVGCGSFSSKKVHIENDFNWYYKNDKFYILFEKIQSSFYWSSLSHSGQTDYYQRKIVVGSFSFENMSIKFHSTERDLPKDYGLLYADLDLEQGKIIRKGDLYTKYCKKGRNVLHDPILDGLMASPCGDVINIIDVRTEELLCSVNYPSLNQWLPSNGRFRDWDLGELYNVDFLTKDKLVIYNSRFYDHSNDVEKLLPTSQIIIADLCKLDAIGQEVALPPSTHLIKIKQVNGELRYLIKTNKPQTGKFYSLYELHSDGSSELVTNQFADYFKYKWIWIPEKKLYFSKVPIEELNRVRNEYVIYKIDYRRHQTERNTLFISKRM